jgi:multiple sugar transport system substrate-binding protein
MSDHARRSPSPTQLGFPIATRRQLLIGAGAASVLAACGSSAKSGSGAATTAAGASTSAAPASSAATTAAAAVTTAAAAGGGTATGTVTFGSNYSDTKPKAAIQAMMDAFPNKNVKVAINTVDHNNYQTNITSYLQQPDDVVSWFAGYRMRFFAAKGLVGDVSDVWSKLSGFSDAFKKSSTGDDGKQYFVPLYYYPWAVHYRKSLFADKGYTIPKTWADFMALADKMKTDGLTPLVAANDGKWPQMGMFDQLNMRTNGYDFHVSLMAGKEKWTDDRVANVFKTWATLLPLQQTGANGRTWQEGANSLGKKETGMYLLGTFVTSNFDPAKDPGAQAIIDDIDFFNFPEIDAKIGADAVEAPIDGFMMAAKPKNQAGAKELLAHIGTAAAEEAYLKVDPSSVAANSKASTSGYTALQKKSAEFVGAAKSIAQFMDRDTNPEFASNVLGPAIAAFLDNPASITDTLKSVEEKKGAIFTS